MTGSTPPAKIRGRFANTPWVIPVVAAAALVLLHSLLRLVLIAQFQFGHAGALSIGKALGIGLVVDCFVALGALFPAVLFFAFLPNWLVRSRFGHFLLNSALVASAALTAFLLVAEFFFFHEFRSRFNTVAVDYLLYPHEVFVNIWDTYPVGWVLLACGLIGLLACYLVGRFFPERWQSNLSWPARVLAACCWTAGLVLFWPVVGNHLTRFSSDRLLNEIAGNGWYSFAQAAVTREFEYAPFYMTADLNDAYQRVRRSVAQTNATFLSEDHSILRSISGNPQNPKLNVVILLEESLGSEFFACLGRTEQTCTPALDKLSEQGLLFTNIYASGNRTVRGMEGVLCSFPPLPGDSVVVRSQGRHIETIARVLRRDGYSTMFIYAGRGVFDRVRSFMMANGYDRFIEQKDFENPQFCTIWGVSNEDLYTRGIEECRKADQAGSPFLLTMLSVSNHKPFTYPKGRIPEDPEERTRENAVKYTDYAIGQFFEAARQERFWTNTIFVVVADHGARVYGQQTIPMKSYEIPFLIVGPAVVKQSARIGTLGGQLDVTPTVLGLIGRPYTSAFFGRDLLQLKPGSGRSLLNHNRDIGLFENNELVVLGLNRTVEFYAGDPKSTELSPLKTPSGDVQADAIAFFQVGNDLYTRDAFRLEQEKLSNESRILSSIVEAAPRSAPK